MWVGMPLLNNNHSLFETAVKVRLRVTKSYQKGYTAAQSYPTLPIDTSLTPVNRNFPMYTFNTSDIKTSTNDNEAAKNALDIINIVPNPYYAYSEYERTSGEKIVKVTNLPEKCTISIYNVGGTLIRRYVKADPKTSLDWDLKNHVGIPVAGGVYLIHVEIPDVGETVIKWFGVARPTDLNGL